MMLEELGPSAVFLFILTVNFFYGNHVTLGERRENHALILPVKTYQMFKTSIINKRVSMLYCESKNKGLDPYSVEFEGTSGKHSSHVRQTGKRCG